MKSIKKNVRHKPHLILSVPALLCFITFITNLVMALKDGNISNNELHQLLATADGFETVVLVIAMSVLKKKHNKINITKRTTKGISDHDQEFKD